MIHLVVGHFTLKNLKGNDYLGILFFYLGGLFIFFIGLLSRRSIDNTFAGIGLILYFSFILLSYLTHNKIIPQVIGSLEKRKIEREKYEREKEKLLREFDEILGDGK